MERRPLDDHVPRTVRPGVQPLVQIVFGQILQLASREQDVHAAAVIDGIGEAQARRGVPSR